MPTIGPTEIAALYAASKGVMAGKLTEGDAAESLQASHGMNYSSAMGYLRKLKQMLSGEKYTRTMNAAATRYYLENIRTDFGAEALAMAVKSVRAHVAYYESLGNGKLGAITRLLESYSATSAEEISLDLDAQVQASMVLTAKQRSQHLPPQGHKPTSMITKTKVFLRNPHVIAAVLHRAAGVCESCLKPAPFKRASTGSPYLEVHHKDRLADGGDDTVENAIAVCPNCHRFHHFG